MKPSSIFFKIVPVVPAILLCRPLSVQAVPVSDLPGTSLLTQFAELGNSLEEHNATISGNVGESAGGKLDLTGPSTINGNVFEDPAATVTGLGTITGSIIGRNMGMYQAQVFSASITLQGLTPDFTSLGSGTFSAGAGNVTVVDLASGLNLKNQGITFTGPGYLVLNIGTSFSMNNHANIFAADPAHVFINYYGSSTASTKGGDVIDGYMFLPDAGANLDGTFTGGIYGGADTVSLMPGATLIQPVPDYGSTTLFLTGMGIACLAYCKRKLVRTFAPGPFSSAL